MPKNRKGRAKAAEAVRAKTRASDDALRAELRNFDIRKLDKALAKAIRPARATARSARE